MIKNCPCIKPQDFGSVFIKTQKIFHGLLVFVQVHLLESKAD